MQLKILLKLGLLLLVILSGITLFVSLILYFSPINSVYFRSILSIKNALAFSKQREKKIGLPIYIKIPSVDIYANIESLGLTPDGAMGVPKGPDHVAWFNLGPLPGEIGSSVIAGHYGWKDETPAIFDNLNKINIGDKIYIENDKGESVVFVVHKIQIYKKDEKTLNIFNSNDGKSHLNLITCTGEWSIEEKTFSERLVVFTDKE